jgi:hypothetical protein
MRRLCKECRSHITLSRVWGSLKLERNNVHIRADEIQCYRIHRGKKAKVEAFEHLEFFQVSGEEHQSSKGAMAVVRSVEKIWTVDSCIEARGSNPRKKSESPEGESYQEFGVQEFGVWRMRVRALDIRNHERAN